MNEFQGRYAKLLREQVEDEIQFLVDHNHSSKQNYTPCMFCYEAKDGSYSCNRLNELSKFQSSIVVSQARQITHSRREIKYKLESVDTTHLELPQLLQPI